MGCQYPAGRAGGNARPRRAARVPAEAPGRPRAGAGSAEIAAKVTNNKVAD